MSNQQIIDRVRKALDSEERKRRQNEEAGLSRQAHFNLIEQRIQDDNAFMAEHIVHNLPQLREAMKKLDALEKGIMVYLQNQVMLNRLADEVLASEDQ